MRQLIQARYQQQLANQAKPCPDEMLAQNAVVFAPHQDDETLGCGGTILRSRALGANVHVVYLTDGRTSHAHLMPPDDLADMRRQEALEACALLGIPAENVHFLDYPDGAMMAHIEPAAPRILSLLNDIEPAVVYVPHHLEPPPDHQATYHAVVAALKQYTLPVTLFGYPVWLWHQWPWVSLLTRDRYELKMSWGNFRQSPGGLALVRLLNTSVDISHVLPKKQAALHAHRSQTTALRTDVPWPTLADVANGRFLQQFFTGCEYFHRYQPNLF